MRTRPKRKLRGSAGGKDSSDRITGSGVCFDVEQPKVRDLIETVARNAAERTLRELTNQAGTDGVLENPGGVHIKMLLAVFDGLEEAIQTVHSLSSASKRRAKRFAPLARLLRRVQGQCLGTLAEFQVRPMEPSVQVDCARDDVLDVLASTEPAADQTVADVVRRGFVRDESVLRPRQVVAFKFVPGGKPVNRNTTNSTQ